MGSRRAGQKEARFGFGGKSGVTCETHARFRRDAKLGWNSPASIDLLARVAFGLVDSAGLACRPPGWVACRDGHGLIVKALGKGSPRSANETGFGCIIFRDGGR
jgi:hypothetical protein